MDDYEGTLARLGEEMTLDAALETPSSNAKEDNAKENTLLGLPRELRDQIWSHVLDSKYENVNRWLPGLTRFEHRMLFFQATSPRITMLQVSRQFNEEGKYRLYHHSTFRANCDFVTGLALPIRLSDTHMMRNIEIQVDHMLLLRRNPNFRGPRDLKKMKPWLAREIEPEFIEQLEQFGSSELRAERCTFYLNTNSHHKEDLPAVIPILHALKGFETLVLKIAICPPRFSSPPWAWLLSEPFKTRLEAVLGEGEYTDHEGRSCLVFKPRDHRISVDTAVSEEMLAANGGKIEDGSVDR